MATVTQRIERLGGAGTGGTGLLTCLKTLGYTAAAKGWQIALTSNYDPATRGAWVEGTLVLSSDEAIVNPVISSFTSVIAFDLSGYLSFGARLREGGTIVWDCSRIKDSPPLDDVTSYGIPIYEMANQAGAPRLANMAMLGVYNRIMGLFSVDDLIAGMESYLPPWRHKLIPANREVLQTVERLDLESYRV